MSMPMTDRSARLYVPACPPPVVHGAGPIVRPPLFHLRGCVATRTPPSACRLRLPTSAHVDVGDLDGVVAVAEAVPGWNLGLHVAGRVGRAGAEAVAAALGRLPCEGPVLPLVWTLGGFDLRRVPVAFAGEADVDVGDRSGARPGLPAHGVGPRGDGCAASGIGDAGAYARDG